MSGACEKQVLIPPVTGTGASVWWPVLTPQSIRSIRTKLRSWSVIIGWDFDCHFSCCVSPSNRSNAQSPEEALCVNTTLEKYSVFFLTHHSTSTSHMFCGIMESMLNLYQCPKPPQPSVPNSHIKLSPQTSALSYLNFLYCNSCLLHPYQRD